MYSPDCILYDKVRRAVAYTNSHNSAIAKVVNVLELHYILAIYIYIYIYL